MKLTPILIVPFLTLGLVGCNQSSPSDINNPEATLPQSADTDTLSADGSSLQAFTYTMDEVSLHNQPTDCWTIIDNKVYDLTAFITNQQHPGGEAIFKACGVDATEFFKGQEKHAENNAARLLPDMYLGDLQSQ